jgi:hypothetical protein
MRTLYLFLIIGFLPLMLSCQPDSKNDMRKYRGVIVTQRDIVGPYLLEGSVNPAGKIFSGTAKLYITKKGDSRPLGGSLSQ